MKNQNTTTAPRRMLDKDIMKTFASVIKNSVIALTLIYPMLLAQAEPELYFVHSDHLNTPQMLTDQNGNVVWQVQSQTPFGIVETNEDVDGDGQAVEFNLRFPGQYYDGETGLSYNYFRDYDPLLGRYIQSDPIGLEGGINTFSYADNLPTSNIDPLGLRSCNFVEYSKCSDYCEGNGGFVKSCSWHGAFGFGAYLCTCEKKFDGPNPEDEIPPDTGDNSSDYEGNQCPDPAKKDCLALKNSILNTCSSLSGNKMMRCFEAANETFRQCMGY
ncbi:RHS repeat-associated protein [Alteromonadaceae bacterium 2753L.S.0a.02]|nr:RHS repeat-associated protein [Alteromonadaceae bacterium 2753L.S.0a.02]